MYISIMFLIAGGFLSAWAAPRPDAPWQQFAELTRHELRRGHFHSLDEDSLHRFDVLKIEPHLRFDLDNTQLSGFVYYDLVADEMPLERIDFRFTHSLTVDSVWVDDAHLASFTAQGRDSIQILITPGMGLGDTLRIGIAYHGNPASIDAWGGFRWAQRELWRPQIAFSMGDGLNLDPPPANYNWIPTHADPTDKVLWEAWFRIPQTRAVTTAGVRLDTLNHGDGTTTWRYRLDQPVSTYLLFIAVSDYVIQTQRETLPLIENFVYPARAAIAPVHFSNVPEVLDGFVQLFGPYPFDRFGFCMTRIGDMEHATCVSHIDAVVVASHTYDWLLFHELAHQWWGDWVTCGDWRDLWLNEGFGTYCEALGMEVLGGTAAYEDYVRLDLFPAARNTNENFPIYDPNYYWGATVYEKGACVMHMLRRLLGDSAFFQAWREYGQEHAFGTAVTADWQVKLEQHYGTSLDWFFQPWVYGRRYPQYRATLDLGDIAVLHIAQTQTTGTLFRMPLDIRVISTENDTTEFTVWNEAVDAQAWWLHHDTIGVVGWPATVEIDPYNKVLKTVVYQTINVEDQSPRTPEDFRIISVFPNPFNPAATLAFDLPHSCRVRFTVYDIAGRAVAAQNLGRLGAGSHTAHWNGADAASGLYFFFLEADEYRGIAKAILLK